MTNKQVNPAAGELVQKLSSEQLLGSAGKLTIEHGGEAYTLRVTKNGKLILTK